MIETADQRDSNERRMRRKRMMKMIHSVADSRPLSTYLYSISGRSVVRFVSYSDAYSYSLARLRAGLELDRPRVDHASHSLTQSRERTIHTPPHALLAYSISHLTSHMHHTVHANR